MDLKQENLMFRSSASCSALVVPWLAKPSDGHLIKDWSKVTKSEVEVSSLAPVEGNHFISPRWGSKTDDGISKCAPWTIGVLEVTPRLDVAASHRRVPAANPAPGLSADHRSQRQYLAK